MSCVACDVCGIGGECKGDCPIGWELYEKDVEDKARPWITRTIQIYMCPACAENEKQKNIKT